MCNRSLLASCTPEDFSVIHEGARFRTWVWRTTASMSSGMQVRDLRASSPEAIACCYGTGLKTRKEEYFSMDLSKKRDSCTRSLCLDREGAAPPRPPQHVCACKTSSGSQLFCKPLTGSNCQLLMSANSLGILESTASISNGAYFTKQQQQKRTLKTMRSQYSGWHVLMCPTRETKALQTASVESKAGVQEKAGKDS